MLVNETVYSVEMTSRDQLVPGKPSPRPARMERQEADAWKLLSDTFIRIGDFVGKGFQTRRIPPWTEAQWRERLSTPGVTPWLAYVDDEVAGFLEVEAQPEGNVEIKVFGLVPEFIGKGYGGHILTLATQIAWDAEPIDGVPVQRVWLHTSTRDHPAALTNYQRRGFQIFHTEEGEREVSLKYEDSDSAPSSAN